jgi:tetratricopeptide (TPR) repeat protein
VKENLREGIKLNKQIIMFLLIIVIGLNFNDVFSQKAQIKPTRQSSFEAFSKGNYELAYNEFTELLLTYSKDPLYKYYSGVCLVNLKRDPEKAEILLQQALQGASVVRTLPSDALLYLGRAQQMGGKYEDALKSFNLFADLVGKKASRELGVPDFIQQCNNKEGKLTNPLTSENVTVQKDEVEVIKNNEKLSGKEAITQPQKNGTLVKSDLPEGYERILDNALDFQSKADSLNALIGDQKKVLEMSSNIDNPAIKTKIAENELLAASFQKSADQEYAKANDVINPQQESISKKEIVQPVKTIIVNDSVKLTDTSKIKEGNIKPDTLVKIVPGVRKPAETLVYFGVLPKPVTDPKEKIVIDPEIPSGLIYRIQIAVFRNPVAPSYFKGITPVYGFRVVGTDKTIYYVGMFRRSSDATKALITVKSKGFKDAFVIALSGNKTVSADRAALMEKEWGKKPFFDIINSQPETLPDTVPPTLTFRVEVMRSLKPVKDDVVEGIVKMAGSRGLDTQTLDDGNIAYLIGKFITFESAAEYADLMIRNGYREAHVVAWLGKKEIPVETAKQLFDSME